jgi:hypothetical protein
MVVVGLALVMLGVSVGMMPGCSQRYTYDLRVVVRDAADARPLADVEVGIQGELIIRRDESPSITNADGVFTASCYADDYQFFPDQLPTWSLVLSKEGYHDEAIDISPARKPDSGWEERRVVVVAYMRARKP